MLGFHLRELGSNPQPVHYFFVLPNLPARWQFQLHRAGGRVWALAWIERLKPRRAILTNLHADLDYEELRAQLPPHVEPAFDGMALNLSVSL